MEAKIQFIKDLDEKGFQFNQEGKELRNIKLWTLTNQYIDNKCITK
jgi:hypothetical protein